MRLLANAPSIVTGLLAAALSAHASGPENLVVNGDFRDGVSSWARIDVVSYSGGGAATPGSARITFPSRPEGGDAMLQCVAVEGFRLYDLGASARLPSGCGRPHLSRLKNSRAEIIASRSGMFLLNTRHGNEGSRGEQKALHTFPADRR